MQYFTQLFRNVHSGIEAKPLLINPENRKLKNKKI